MLNKLVSSATHLATKSMCFCFLLYTPPKTNSQFAPSKIMGRKDKPLLFETVIFLVTCWFLGVIIETFFRERKHLKTFTTFSGCSPAWCQTPWPAPCPVHCQLLRRCLLIWWRSASRACWVFHGKGGSSLSTTSTTGKLVVWVGGLGSRGTPQWQSLS